MARRIRVRGVPRQEPNVRLYVLALIELARQLEAEEAAAELPGNPGESAPEPSEDTRDG
jgi:hypothetical protein